jgi:hypothetical protein
MRTENASSAIRATRHPGPARIATGTTRWCVNTTMKEFLMSWAGAWNVILMEESHDEIAF